MFSEAPQENGQKKISGDRYTVGYKPSTGKITTFYPPGGIAFNHTHVLSKAPLLDSSVGTYDLYNWTGGDQNSGSIIGDDPNYYFASGGANSGTYEEQVSIAAPDFKVFSSGSQIGNRTVISEGVPIYQNEDYQFSNAGTYQVTVPAELNRAVFTLYGGSGSGSVYTKAGNSGQGSTMVLDPFLLLPQVVAVVVKLYHNNRCEGGAYGGQTTTGSAAGDVSDIASLGSGNGTDGGPGPTLKILLQVVVMSVKFLLI